MRVKIHREGTNILIILLAALLLVNVPLWLWMMDCIWIPIIVLIASTIFYLLVVNFFRSPHRDFPGDPENAVVASADGEVVALENVYEPEYLKTE